MTDEQAIAFAALQDGFRQFAQACEQVWNAIVEVVAPVIRAIARWYWQLRAAHLIPRQYRDTMARRKIRHYMQFCVRR